MRSSFRIVVLATALASGTAAGQSTGLARYFGFDGLEIVKIGDHAGPMSTADLDGDGRTDLIVINNHASRIELRYQDPAASPELTRGSEPDVNEHPEHWRFRQEYVSVSHRITAVVAYDFDHDGRMDLIYAGLPRDLVFLRQTSKGTFEVARKHRVRALAANRNGFAVADIIGDDGDELLAIVDGNIHIWSLDGAELGQPTQLAAGENIIGFALEDYNGDGRIDIAAGIPDDPAPVRLWLAAEDGGESVLGAQARFEMPPLFEFEPVRLPGRAGALIAVIERASKRLVVYEVTSVDIDSADSGDPAMLVHSFTDAGNRQRAVAPIDVDGDGLLDLVATDTRANTLVVYRQTPGKGLQPGESYPCYAEVEYLAVGNVDDDASAELFVLSEEESVVGWCDINADGVPYPSPLPVPEGATPVALSLVQLDDGPRAAIIAKSGRNHVIALIDMEGNSEEISLGSVSKSPETIIDLDADHDGHTDLLLFTRDKPMTMLHATEGDFTLRESKDMGQYGLVKAATADNTAVFDVDEDGHDDLLIADRNFVRAVRYDPNPAAGISPGWQVIAQISADDPGAKLVSLTILGSRIVAADGANDQMLVFERDASDGKWSQVKVIDVRGFAFDTIYAGAFSGDGEENILAVGDDGFALIRLGGERPALREFAAWRTDEEDRLQHELATGDVNGDGLTDMISLDAGEQMCEIFTFSQSGRMLYATGFQVFESKIFSGGDVREFQPSEVIVADITGDGAQDLLLLAHDRVLIYPQMTKSPE